MYIGFQSCFEKRLHELIDLQGKIKKFKIRKVSEGYHNLYSTHGLGILSFYALRNYTKAS